MENRSGLLFNVCLTQADRHGERIAALAMIELYADRPRPITLEPTEPTTREISSMSCAQ